MSTNRPHWSSFCVIFYNSSTDCINLKKKNKHDYEIYLNIVLCNQDRKTMSDVCLFVYARSSQSVVRGENAKAGWSKFQIFGRGLEDHS